MRTFFDTCLILLAYNENPSFQRSVDRRSSVRSDDYDEWDSRYMLRTDHDDFAAAYNDM